MLNVNLTDLQNIIKMGGIVYYQDVVNLWVESGWNLVGFFNSLTNFKIVPKFEKYDIRKSQKALKIPPNPTQTPSIFYVPLKMYQ